MKSQTNLEFFVDQITVFYMKHTGTPYHVVTNDVDIEDICDYFFFVLNEEERKKQKEMMDKFEGL